MIKSYFIAFLIGFSSALSLPFFFLLPFLIIGFYYLYTKIKSLNNKREFFLYGLFFGFGHFLLGFHWIVFPLLFEEKHYLLIPLIIIIFPLFLSIFFAFPSLIVGVYLKKNKLNYNNNIFFSSFVFGCTFYFFEYLRCILFGGFPWNLFGHIWAFNNNFLIVSKYVGIYGLSFLTIFWVFLVTQLFSKKKYKSSALIFFILPLILLTVGLFENQTQPTTNLKVRLVQPNISQEIKWSKYHFEENIRKLIALSKKPGKFENIPNIIVWPEVALTFFLNEEVKLRNEIINSFSDETIILTGALRKEQSKVFNSFYAISKKSFSSYDKLKLVPFGEYMPLRNFLPFKKMTEGSVDFTKGLERKELLISSHANGGVSFEPSICYEGIFPEKSIKGLSPSFLVNITNDAWFGNTTGPYQHMIAAKFRAIERGLPMIRVANSGISAAFNKNGQIIKSIPHNKEGFVDVVIEIANNQTIYSKYGESVLIFLVSFIFIFVMGVDFFLKKKVAKI